MSYYLNYDDDGGSKVKVDTGRRGAQLFARVPRVTILHRRATDTSWSTEDVRMHAGEVEVLENRTRGAGKGISAHLEMSEVRWSNQTRRILSSSQPLVLEFCSHIWTGGTCIPGSLFAPGRVGRVSARRRA